MNEWFTESDSRTNLVKALFAFQNEVDGIKKTSTNPYFKSKYANINTIWEEVQPLFEKHGFVVSHCPVGDGYLMTHVDHVPSGEWRRYMTKLPTKESGPQAEGSAITYYRRYTLVALFALMTEDDDGNAATHPPVNIPSRINPRAPSRTNNAPPKADTNDPRVTYPGA